MQGIRQFHEVIIKEKEVQRHTEYIYHPINANPGAIDSVVNYANLDVTSLLDPSTYVIIDSNSLTTSKPYGVSRPISQYQDYLQELDVQLRLNPMTGDKELTGIGITYSEGRNQLIQFFVPVNDGRHGDVESKLPGHPQSLNISNASHRGLRVDQECLGRRKCSYQRSLFSIKAALILWKRIAQPIPCSSAMVFPIRA